MPLKSFSKQEIMLTERWRFERPLLGMILLGVLIFSGCEGLGAASLFYASAATMAVAINWMAVRQRKEVFVQRWIVNAAVILATVVLIVEFLTTDTQLMVALGHYLILIQLCKLFEHKTNRDYVQMFALSGLLMVDAAMICISPWWSLAMIAYLAAASYTTMIFTLKRGLDAAASARLAHEKSPQDLAKVAWNVIRIWPAKSMRRLTLVTVILMLLTGTAIFLTAPRGLAQAQSAVFGRSTRQTGLAGDMQLGDARQIYQSQDVLMRLRITALDGQSPAGRYEPYLKAMSLERYGDSRWTRGWAGPRDRPGPRWRGRGRGVPPPDAADWQQPIKPVEPPKPPPPDLSHAVALDVTMSPELLPLAPALYPVAHVLKGDRIVEPDHNDMLMLDHRLGGTEPINYRALCLPQPLSAEHVSFLAQRRLNQRPVQPAGAAVEVTPRVAELARQWTADLLEESDRYSPDQLHLLLAARLASRLRTHCSYTLDLSEANPGRDGVEDFVFHMRKGHCEYFASALAVMCNAVGVRARVATGFHFDEYDAQANQFVVRGRDAHAWTEVYTESTDWVIFDATPAAQAQQAAETWTSGLRRMLADMEFAWNDGVLGYDDSDRQRVWSAIADAFSAATDAVKAAAGRLSRSVVNLLLHGYIDVAMLLLIGALLLATALAEGLIVVRLVRRRALAAQRLRRPSCPADLPFMRRLLKLLRRSRLKFAPGATLREVVSQAAGPLGLGPQALMPLVDLYYALRWGQQEPTDDQLRQAQAAVEELERQARRPIRGGQDAFRVNQLTS